MGTQKRVQTQTIKHAQIDPLISPFSLLYTQIDVADENIEFGHFDAVIADSAGFVEKNRTGQHAIVCTWIISVI